MRGSACSRGCPISSYDASTSRGFNVLLLKEKDALCMHWPMASFFIYWSDVNFILWFFFLFALSNKKRNPQQRRLLKQGLLSLLLLPFPFLNGGKIWYEIMKDLIQEVFSFPFPSPSSVRLWKLIVSEPLTIQTDLRDRSRCEVSFLLWLVPRSYELINFSFVVSFRNYPTERWSVTFLGDRYPDLA